ncbi:MAG: hypothetical protein ACP5T3_00195 [Candidatus Micrarchaeia archaeon]
MSPSVYGPLYGGFPNGTNLTDIIKDMCLMTYFVHYNINTYDNSTLCSELIFPADRQYCLENYD